jgi:mycofactocin system creatininase family protein
MRLDDLTWTELDGRDPPLLVVPIGSTEQHGPHLPLATDRYIAEAIAEGLRATRDDALVAPSLAVTASGEHAGFPGTLSIGAHALTEVVIELARSADWARRLVLINGHGGNREAIDRAVTRLAHEGRSVLSWWPSVSDGDAHGGHTETSLMLAIAPQLVHIERAEAGNTTPLVDLVGDLRSRGVRAVSPNGVLGDPAGASAAAGEAILARLVDDVSGIVQHWLES